MLQEYILPSTSSVKDAIERMHSLSSPAIIIADDDCVVKGLFTSGDMRKFFLQGGATSSLIAKAMNIAPILFHSWEEIQKARKERPRIVYPLVDAGGRIVEVHFSENHVITNDEMAGVPLVVMAGGKGLRLYPYTRILPKALIPLGNSTISEHIIRQFYNLGCREVHFVVNHKANMIKAYFNDIARDYDVYYHEEDEFLGTGGGLYLLRDAIKSTFILSNCDILIRDDFVCAFRTHKERGNDITFICAMANTGIPYGVIDTDENGLITAIREKPEFSFLVNTGVYIVEPGILDDLQEPEFIHFPDIAKRCIEANKRVGAFPVSEKAWMDIGEISKMGSVIEQFDAQSE